MDKFEILYFCHFCLDYWEFEFGIYLLFVIWCLEFIQSRTQLYFDICY